MQIHYHGGLCCGVKTISGFYVHPAGQVGQLYSDDNHLTEDDEDDEDVEDFRPDLNGNSVSSEWNFFISSAPLETAKDRLKRYIEYLADLRPGGVVEIVLTYTQKDIWGDILAEFGFVQYVPTFRNSNTGADLYMYHLVMKESD